jgi:hypothetical protein
VARVEAVVEASHQGDNVTDVVRQKLKRLRRRRSSDSKRSTSNLPLSEPRSAGLLCFDAAPSEESGKVPNSTSCGTRRLHRGLGGLIRRFERNAPKPPMDP